MKSLLFVIALLFSVTLFAQDSNDTTVKAPVIITKLPIQKTATLKGVTIKFVSVVSDSRCPKNVNCIWAGEVVLLVDVQHGGNKAEAKTITIGFKRNPTGHETDIIFKDESLTIQAMNVLPYPEYGVEVNASDYVLLLDVEAY
ncbi:hypothetical protein ES677_13675 [Bizionia gelidisalsuginis]|uniref:DUF4920 domain-containing protein n=1 Tax=Bizionia gelidisalsuginis TaxID=291188 RepID=A0ABY3M7H9_9FLAO|nr:hypothetical protein [Bizionia gelidisalsuginis]TYC09148.1 hypothetical protein ES677_13675 [Bizionia gelidisalsuginis]